MWWPAGLRPLQIATAHNLPVSHSLPHAHRFVQHTFFLNCVFCTCMEELDISFLLANFCFWKFLTTPEKSLKKWPAPAVYNGIVLCERWKSKADGWSQILTETNGNGWTFRPARYLCCWSKFDFKSWWGMKEQERKQKTKSQNEGSKRLLLACSQINIVICKEYFTKLHSKLTVHDPFITCEQFSLQIGCVDPHCRLLSNTLHKVRCVCCRPPKKKILATLDASAQQETEIPHPSKEKMSEKEKQTTHAHTHARTNFSAS